MVQAKKDVEQLRSDLRELELKLEAKRQLEEDVAAGRAPPAKRCAGLHTPDLCSLGCKAGNNAEAVHKPICLLLLPTATITVVMTPITNAMDAVAWFLSSSVPQLANIL